MVRSLLTLVIAAGIIAIALGLVLSAASLFDTVLWTASMLMYALHLVAVRLKNQSARASTQRQKATRVVHHVAALGVIHQVTLIVLSVSGYSQLLPAWVLVLGLHLWLWARDDDTGAAANAVLRRDSNAPGTTTASAAGR